MKKLFAVFFCVILCFALGMTFASAEVEDDICVDRPEQPILDALSQEVKVGNATFKFPVEYINQAKNYFLAVDLTEDAFYPENVETVVDNINRAIDAFKYDENVINTPAGNGDFSLSNLTAETKTEVLDCIESAATALHLTADYNAEEHTITLYYNHDGVAVQVFEGADVIKKTGVEVNLFVAILFTAICLAVVITCIVMIQRMNRVKVKD